MIQLQCIEKCIYVFPVEGGGVMPDYHRIIIDSMEKHGSLFVFISK